MFESFDELLNYIKHNNNDISINYDTSSKNLLVFNNKTEQILFNQCLNYQIGEFKSTIEPLFQNLNCNVNYLGNSFS